MLEKLNDIIKNIREEISRVDEVDGLCYYTSNNIVYDLDKENIYSSVFNIREMADVNYDHYFVLADINAKTYLIDITYNQFLSSDKSLIFFDKWPGDVLKEKNGKLLGNLLDSGFSRVLDGDLYDYLTSFNQNFIPLFTIEDLISIRKER